MGTSPKRVASARITAGWRPTGTAARRLNFRGSSVSRARYLSHRLNRRGVASRETGYVDTAAAGYNCDTTGSIALIGTIPQGTSVQERVGKKVILKSIQMRGRVETNAAATAIDCAVLIVYDKRPTGSLPAVADVLVSASPNAFNNDVNSGRFRILRRYDFVLVGSAANAYTEASMKDASDYFKVNRPEIFKAAGTGAIGDIEEGAVYVVTVGGLAAGTGAATATLAFRTRFIDV